MEIDQYAFCPCGSGKKFKWCCQHIYHDIERAYTQLEQGQQDAALRIIDEATARHPDNPEVWGQKAQLLLALERKEEAEQALDRAFGINPNYPFGLLMQARLRSDEGSFTGALILARRAAEAYHPDALEYLAQVYALIYQLEMRRNRPVAAHAALRILVHCQPSDPELRQAIEEAFGPESHLPACARKKYEFLSPSAALAPERRQAWNRAIEATEGPRLSSLAAAFEQLTTEDPADAPAWWNLAVVQAWLGENRKALDALDRYLPLEGDDSRATQAAALGEVLRCCDGMENECDYRQYIAEYRCRDMEPLGKLFQEWAENRRAILRQVEERRAITGMILEPDAPAIITSGSNAVPDMRLAGYLVLTGDYLRVWGSNEGAMNRLREEIRTKTRNSLDEGPVSMKVANFGDTVSEALVFPGGEGELTPEQSRQAMLDKARQHYEEVWIHRPLRSLAGNTPLDAAGQPVLRKKLLGVIQFLQDCAANGILSDYDFGGLRHKLGLTAGPAPEARPVAVAVIDPTAMNTGELAALNVDSLSDEQLERAYQAAQKLDAGEVATKFGKALVSRPLSPERQTDRFPMFSFLLQRALNEGDLDVALDYVNEGERQDCEHNAGRRRNDYELRRAQVHVKRREADQAHDVFTRLIERVPDNLKFRGSAAEGMLSLRQPKRALTFAEEGLAVARRQNDRDSEQYLMELVEAAKRQS